MLDLAIEKIGELAVVECHGKIVRSDAVFKLREAVTSLPGMGIIVLDLSEVSAIEAGGLDMLLFLLRWAYDRDVQLKLFNPRMFVRDRLECLSSMPQFHIVPLPEVMHSWRTRMAALPWLPEAQSSPRKSSGDQTFSPGILPTTAASRTLRCSPPFLIERLQSASQA